MIKRQKFKNYDVDYTKIDNKIDEETELPNITSVRKEIPTVEKTIQEGDSLQSLAITYHCTIEDLKRLNNIQKENEIFAKRIIKVPYRLFAMPLIHLSGRNSPENTILNNSVCNLEEFNGILCKNLQELSKTDSTSEVNKIIFNSNIIKVNENKNDTIVPELEEEVQLLPQHQRGCTEPVISKLSCSGADGDISWITLIVCTCIIIVAVPLIYVFYIAEHLEKYAHHNS